MKFLVDAHLPAAVCRVLCEAGHDVLHTVELPDANRTKDRAINERSSRDQRVIVSKDTESYYSHLLQGRRTFNPPSLRPGVLRIASARDRG